MKGKHVAGLLATGVALGLVCGPASAFISSWNFQDDSIDALYRDGGFIDPATCTGSGDSNCQIGIGDVLVTVFEYPSFTIDGANAIPAGMEVTGVAAIQYLEETTDPIGNTVRSYGAYSGGLDAILAVGGGAAPLPDNSGVAGGSAMVATFINRTDGVDGDRDLDFDIANTWASNCTSYADCIDQATRGSLLQVDGGIFSDGTKLDPDNFWLSGTGGADIYDAWQANPNFNLAGVNAGLSVLYNTVEPIVPQKLATGTPDGCLGTNEADGCVDFVLQSNATGGGAGANPDGGPDGNGGLQNGFFAHDTTISSAKFVPEPATLTLFGASLLGLGLGRRRKG